jgi:hypothetical protein
MVATVGSIAIDLSTNVAKFASGFKSAATTVDRESGRMAKSIARVDRASKAAGSVLSGFVGGIAAGGALAAIGSLSGAIGKASKALEDFEEIGNRAKTVGLRNDTFQAISFGALQADVSQEKLNSSLEIFAKNMGLAQAGGGALFSSLKRLNPELLQTLVTTNDQELRLRKVAEAFAQTSDATERAALATAVFGKGGIDMVRVLEGGSQAIAKLKREAKDLGVIVPDELIEKAGMLDDKLAALGKIIDINISQALINAAPILVATAEGMAAFAKEINATSIELTKFAENPGLDSLKNLLDYFFDVEITGGVLGAIRDGLTETSDEIKLKITELEEKLVDLELLGSEIDLLNRDKIAEDIDFLKGKLAELASAAVMASENSSRAAHKWLAESAANPTGGAVNSNTESGVNVTRYERSTAENTERTADTLEDQSTAYKGYFENLEETLKNDVTGGITKYIQQLIYAQELATQSISEAVQAGIGIASRDSSGGSTASWAGRQFKVKVGGDIQQTVYDPRVHGSPEEFANLGLSTGGLKMNYAGMFAEGGSFIAPGNQTGDTTRLLMDVNGGERVTVSPAGDSGKSITLNFYAAQGENEATMRQRARKAGEEIGRQLARA